MRTIRFIGYHLEIGITIQPVHGHDGDREGFEGRAYQCEYQENSLLIKLTLLFFFLLHATPLYPTYMPLLMEICVAAAENKLLINLA